MEKQTAIVHQPPVDIMTLGMTLAKSGYFSDAKDAAQAVVKVLAGQELGFGPIASMTGIFIVKGRVTLSANMIAAAIKRSGKYNYVVRQLDGNGCSIEFFESGKSVGISNFTLEDAKKAELLASENWRKYPRNMFFARALSNGARWYCPDVFGGPVYTPDELSTPASEADIDLETGEIIAKEEENGSESPALPPARNEAEAKRAFFQRVLDELPSFENVKEVIAALRQAGFERYQEENEAAMFEALQARAQGQEQEQDII